jgi:hypothetical protein
MLSDSYLLHWSSVHTRRFADYAAGTTSWVVGLSPELAVNLPGEQVVSILRERLGESFSNESIASPQSGKLASSWLANTHTVGVNIRTIGDFWSVVKYALTLPNHIQGVHLLPVWEPGVVGSLYGMASWQLNPEFYSDELYQLFPELRRLEDQLKFVVNVLHGMGKVVGMDVIPHTDRYSEMVLANPDMFEWLRRVDTSIVDHRAWLHEEVQGAITAWLAARGPAMPAYGIVGGLWQLPEADRLKLFFGHPDNFGGRQGRRIDLVDWLYHRGLEPAPATMAPPYRGLVVNPDPSAKTVDKAGRVWRDYMVSAPTEMSRAFGPLTRYKFYARKADNKAWEIDFDQPRTWVWDYFTGHYAEQQAKFGFDFMRGDMSHVQMRPDGVPAVADKYYDPLRAVKKHIAANPDASHFAYFAESFLERPGFMAYGDEVEHLERSEADVTLGNLQSMVPGSDQFWAIIDHYLKVEATTSLTPAWAVITGDKDDPRFDHFHHFGELARVFTGLFLGKLPMYFSLGFEQRDRHLARAENEAYSKLYVFQEKIPDKAVSGPFQWGNNLELFSGWTRLQEFAGGLQGHLGEATILEADVDTSASSAGANLAGVYAERSRGTGAKRVGTRRVFAWFRPSSDGDGAYLFVASFDETPVDASIALPVGFGSADLLFATEVVGHEVLAVEGGVLRVEGLNGGRCYRVANS